jgi:hypothetical protein
MKLICFLAVLMAICSSAHAGGSISFSVGGHRVHIESSRYCRSPSCASVSVSRSLDWRRRRDRFEDDGRDAAVPGRPAPRIASPPSAPPAVTPPAQTIVATPPAVYRPAATETQIVAAPSPPVQPVSIPLPPPPPEIAKPVESVRPAPRVSTASQEVEDKPADLPIGDWQTEGKGMVRIAKCGTALCGYAINSSSNDKGEAILINMKPKTDRQWTGSVYSQASGDTYYGTISMKGANTLRVEACVLGRFYCSGNDWSRITRHAEGLIPSRQVPGWPRI